jgi:hypothetical protein
MPDTPVAPRDDGPYDPLMEARVSRLEEDMRDVKTTLPRLEAAVIRIETMLAATLPHLATKADLAEVRTEMKADHASLRTELKADYAELKTELKSDIARLEVAIADKPGRTYLWAVLGVLLTAYACGLAGLAILK